MIVLSVFYVISLIIISAIIHTFIHRNDKKCTEIDVFINNNDEYWFG